jgi:hypothetical protein
LTPLLVPTRPLRITLIVVGVVAVALAAILWEARVEPPDAHRVRRIQALAGVIPPQPSPEAMRAAADDRIFARGLEAYASAHWDDAVDALARVDRDDARFYRGVAELMRGSDAAAEPLLRAVEDSGAVPYAREAVFYRVKAALAQQDLPSARGLITEAVRIGAGPPGEAARLRDELEVLR